MEHHLKKLRRLQRLARLLDSSWGIPGTRVRFGADALLGLIPGGGDAVGLALSGYIVWQAWQLGVSRPTLTRMIANVGLDTLVGAVPALGDLFDVAFKCNIRNLKLLEADVSAMPPGIPAVPVT
jgi:hypothetical protein